MLTGTVVPNEGQLGRYDIPRLQQAAPPCSHFVSRSTGTMVLELLQIQDVGIRASIALLPARSIAVLPAGGDHPLQ
jgi:hypothetical protein